MRKWVNDDVFRAKKIGVCRCTGWYQYHTLLSGCDFESEDLLADRLFCHDLSFLVEQISLIHSSIIILRETSLSSRILSNLSWSLLVVASIAQKSPTMMAIMNKLWLTSLVLAWWMQESHDAGVLVLARPLGAPVCPTGRSAPGDPHRPGSGFTEGEIADSGDLMIAIDGEELMVGTPMDVSAGMSHNVTITSTGSFFRGVLAILSDSADATVDTTSLISIMDGEQDLQISSPCLSSGVSFYYMCPFYCAISSSAMNSLHHYDLAARIFFLAILLSFVAWWSHAD